VFKTSTLITRMVLRDSRRSKLQLML